MPPLEHERPKGLDTYQSIHSTNMSDSPLIHLPNVLPKIGEPLISRDVNGKKITFILIESEEEKEYSTESFVEKYPFKNKVFREIRIEGLAELSDLPQD